ncbi:protein ECT2 isoform X2 [Aethina tumida]|uniref:protein ECT2 isoform X2 n=1 Tax=Aethina tumida TaxID=116153 RepID=UPI0021484825|nr:protein ECT2 isoform X2 [Aethina tumida]
MDVVNAQIKSQSSICSESTADEAPSRTASTILDRRICLVGDLQNDVPLRRAADTFDVPVVTSNDGREYIDGSFSTVFVVKEFEGDIFTYLSRAKQCILGPPALQQLAQQEKPLPCNTRPLYNLAMNGVVLCLTGFKVKDELQKLVPLIHHMGGSIRKDVSEKVTHLIANVVGGEKYIYAKTFRVPTMNRQWVYDSWERRNDLDFRATQDKIINEHKLNVFHGVKVCFFGFAGDEERHMTEVLIENGGTATTTDDPSCTHVVMEQSEVFTLEPTSGPLSPKPKPPEPVASPVPVQNTRTPSQLNSCCITGMFSSKTQTMSCLETLKETSQDELSNGMDSMCFEQSFDLNSTHAGYRKRKFPSPEQSSVNAKRKRDKSYSEKRKKVTEFFKTPINLFSNRRRTIDATSFSQSMNDSVLSSSGVFNVETVQNLSCYNDDTPRGVKRLKKSLFNRTFSSSKFLRSSKNKKCDLNATRLSFGEAEEPDGADKINASCFPDFSLNTNHHHTLHGRHPSHSESNEVKVKAARGISASSVVDEQQGRGERPGGFGGRAHIVRAEWFWTSVQKEYCLEETDYIVDEIDNVLSPNARRDSNLATTPGSHSRRKRKRLQNEILSSLAHDHQSPSLHKRRSSISDAGLLSCSGSFLDFTHSPDASGAAGAEPPVPETPKKQLTARHQVFLELVHTERNYVGILETILNLFKKELEEMPDDTALLNNTELNLIFGKLPLIYEAHSLMFKEFEFYLNSWTEEAKIGDTIVKFSTNLLKAYPPFINNFEVMKETIDSCDNRYPRFHAFLRAKLTKPECGRQSLQELLIRPVQRLGSISLLLNDILKHTPKTNPDHASLEQALAALREVMTHINEDKRKAECQVKIFTIFNEIDNCPPEIVSSHRNFVAKTEVIVVSTSDGLASKGSNLVLFLFSDRLEVCKKKSKAFNSLKSPSTVNNLPTKALSKYKHIKLLSLNAIKRVLDMRESDHCENVFGLVCRHNDEVKEQLYSFRVVVNDDSDREAGKTDDLNYLDKPDFVRTLTRQMANNACTADADQFLAYIDPQQLDIDTTDLNNGTLSKAFKFATRTRLKVGRAFSFNKTPSKLKRAVSSMMSPFGSSTNLTPASQLAQMKLASYTNINELGNAENSEESPPPVAPMSVQPTRKMKSASLGVNALKRL